MIPITNGMASVFAKALDQWPQGNDRRQMSLRLMLVTLEVFEEERMALCIGIAGII
jgi:hypothetical protein